MKPLFRFATALFLATAVFPQTPQFEVASIRPSAPISMTTNQVNVGVRLDGSQARLVSFSFRDYVALAYRMRNLQVTGPAWIESARFDVNATLPEGAKSNQIPDMMQALLADRFQLKFHREQKEMPVYVLSLGKAPLQLKEVPSDGVVDLADVTNIAASGSGNGVAVNLGNGSTYTFSPNKFEGKKLTLDIMASMLERYLDRPILNQTGLKGAYDLTLEVAPEDYFAMLIRAATASGVTLPAQAMRMLEGNTTPSLFDAIEKLGLKLEAKKLPQDVIVVDSALKMPTEN
jgi:uncharacterized protein (TIGR03435 family)